MTDFDFKIPPKTSYDVDPEEDPGHLPPGQILIQPKIARLRAKESTPEITYVIYGELTTDDNSYGHSYAAFECVSNGTRGDRPVFIKTPRLSRRTTRSTQVAKRLGDITSLFQELLGDGVTFKELNKPRRTTPNILGLGHYLMESGKQEFVQVPFLVQEFVNELPMSRFLENYRDRKYANVHGFRGITDPADWFAFATRIVEVVRRVHNRQLIHGEIAHKNVLMWEDGGPDNIHPILVDFARSSRLDFRLTQGSLSRRHNSYVAPECRDREPEFDVVADIYSLGGLLYYLATGDPPPDINQPPSVADSPVGIQRDTDEWKALIHASFQKAAGSLGSRNEGIAKIIDKCMRPNPSDRFPSAEKVLHALSAVNYESPIAPVQDQIQALNAGWSTDFAVNRDQLFSIIVSDKLELLNKEIADMRNGHYEIYGEREDIIDTLIKYIGVLRPGDVYATITIPEYWTEQNLGVNGRFLTVNKDLARNGVLVNRLFLTTDADFKEESARRILTAHYDAWAQCGPEARALHPLWKPSWSNDDLLKRDDKLNAGALYLGFLNVATEEERRALHRAIRYVAIWKRYGIERTMAIVFFTKPIYGRDKENGLTVMGTQVVKVRFRELTDDSDYRALIETFDDNRVSGPEMLGSRLGRKPSAIWAG